MQLACKVFIANTSKNQPMQVSSGKFVKGTLAISKSRKDVFYILLILSNKTPRKFAVKDNVAYIFTRFINEGRATIRFKEPEQDLMIQADATELKNLLILLKMLLQDKLKAQEAKGLSSKSRPPIKRREVKLIIQDKSTYPTNGFEPTLKELQINYLPRNAFDTRILRLEHLRVLDLSNNSMQMIPESLNSMKSLVELNLSGNRLTSSAVRKWDWMGGCLAKTLVNLNLANNQMRIAPNQLIRLQSLHSLDVSHNLLITLPDSIGRMSKLKRLNASYNPLESFPGSIKKLHFQTLEVSGIDFTEANNAWADAMHEKARNIKPLPVLSLRDIAGRKVLCDQLEYCRDTLPLSLIHFLESTSFCFCGKACFDQCFVFKFPLSLRCITQELGVTGAGNHFATVDNTFCSVRCFNRTVRKLSLRR